MAKLLKVHSTPKAEIPASAWNNTQEALKRGELFDLGLPAAETPIGSPSGDGQLLLGVAESLMHYRYVIENDMVSQNSAGVFDLFQIGLRNLKERQSPVEKYSIIAVWEKFPDLKSLLGEIESPFTRIARFRQTHTAVRFRDWVSTAAGTDLELVREYVNACAERKRLFESKPAKFMKIVSLIALSHVAGFEATATVGAVLMTRIPSEIINEVLKLSAEVGTGVIDSFLIDTLQVGWTPKAYFDGLRKLRRNEPENKSS
jgi:hypothetical protein